MSGLSSGARLGVYEVISPLGAGGMGEVYRARDSKLGRQVAIKIVSESAFHDPDRVARFEREAQILAALNHPHIAAIYGLEQANDLQFLVLELVEGETLADRLRASGSGLQASEALDIARQVADALEAAHEKGIIHRDLKPANIALTSDGQVKVLDFGLAKALDGTSASSSVADSPTISLAATQAGVILGTAAYMSPEQAKGKAADKRTDVWAFGCVLFEMLTGTRAFAGEDLTDTIAAVVRGEPDWGALPADLPPQIAMLIRRCLVKDRKQRIADISVAKFLMTETLPAPASATTATSSPTVVVRRRPLLDRSLGLIAGLALSAAAVAAFVFSRPATPARPVRFAIVPPSTSPLNLTVTDRDIAISPDGTQIVYKAGAGAAQLAVRSLDQIEARLLPANSTGRAPFFSFDGSWIGYFDGADLKKVAVTGGPSITLCRATGGARGASWGADDTIVFATNDPSTGLFAIPAGGGDPQELIKPDASGGEGDYHFPSVLPNGRGVLFTIASAQPENAQIAVLDLQTRQKKTLVRGGSHAEYADTGHLVYAAAGTLRAVRFDLERLEVIGNAFPILEGVMTGATGAAQYALSKSGTIVYVPGLAGGGTSARSLVWVDRQGREEPLKAPARAYQTARISPDGSRIAAHILDQENDVWVWHKDRQTLTRLTFDAATDREPLWTPDGRRIIFGSSRVGAANLFWKLADGTGPDERVSTSPNLQLPTSISPDGTRLLIYEVTSQRGPDIRMVNLDSPGVAGQARVTSLIETTFVEFNAVISPDARWFAYQSSESGSFEIYVRPFPTVDGGHWQVSNGGGMKPAWAPNGKELFYLRPDGVMVGVPVLPSTGASFSSGIPAPVVEAQKSGGRYFLGGVTRNYDVAADGRFLMIKEAASDQNANAPLPSMVVVLNWLEELKTRVK